MNRRSRYHGVHCASCSKAIATGRVAFCTTFYVPSNQDVVVSPSTHSMTNKFKKNLKGWKFPVAEIEVQVAFHRRCLERLLKGAPREPDEAQERFDNYRAELLERYAPSSCMSATDADESISP